MCRQENFKSHYLMKHKGSLPCSQEPAHNPILNKWVQSTTSQSISRRSILKLSSHLHVGLISTLFPSRFHRSKFCKGTNLIPPMRATCTAHLTFLRLILIDNNTWWTAQYLVMCVYYKSDKSRMKMTAFWDITPCSLVETDRRFRGGYCPADEGSKHLWNVNFHETTRRNITEDSHLS
jgi:hypothetical protein